MVILVKFVVLAITIHTRLSVFLTCDVYIIAQVIIGAMIGSVTRGSFQKKRAKKTLFLFDNLCVFVNIYNINIVHLLLFLVGGLCSY